VLRAVLALPVNEAAQKDAHNALAVLLDQTQGRLEHAEHHLRAALSVDPAYAPAVLNLANCLWQQYRMEEAEALFRQAVALQPDETEYVYSLAAAHFELGRSAEARRGFEQALRLSPGSTHALLGIGHVLRDQHQGVEAAAAYRAVYNAVLAREHKRGTGPQYRSLGRGSGGGRQGDGGTGGGIERSRQDWQSQGESCGGNPEAIQAVLLEFSAHLAAGNHCRLPAAQARACLLAAINASAPPEPPGGWGARAGLVVTANMYDALQLDPSGLVIKQLAALRGRALQGEMDRLVARLAWHPAPAPFLDARRPEMLVAMVSASFDGEHYVTHAVARLAAALRRQLLPGASRPRVRLLLLSTARPDACSPAGLKHLAAAAASPVVAAHSWSPLAIAKFLNAQGAHVLIPVDGFARGERLRVAAARPAPVAALWLGYAGTVGMPR